MSDTELPTAAEQPVLETRLAEFSAAVDDYTRALLDQADHPPDLAGMLRYHLGWVDEHFRPVAAARGKRLRPALCLLVCEAAGGTWATALPAAAAVELIHNFSLVHDDIEDRSPLRRHRPTLWTLWGQAPAINAGDALFVEAQLALLHSAWPTERCLAAARALNRACRELCSGQHRDLSPAGAAEPTLTEYYAMINGKTAALIAVAAELGALADDCPPAVQAAYHRFGRELGLAFQLRDDLLDVWGVASQTGKPVREDLRTKKCSLPIVLAFTRAHAAQREQLHMLYQQPAPLDEPTVAALVALLDQLDVRAEGERLMRAHYAAALAALAAARPRAPAAAQLRALAELLLTREA